jgi:hypothetical protein
VELAEAEVEAAESRVTTLTAALEDPVLYTSHDGVAKAARMGAELEVAKEALDQALERWTQATEAVEAIAER